MITQIVVKTKVDNKSVSFHKVLDENFGIYPTRIVVKDETFPVEEIVLKIDDKISILSIIAKDSGGFSFSSNEINMIFDEKWYCESSNK